MATQKMKKRKTLETKGGEGEEKGRKTAVTKKDTSLTKMPTQEASANGRTKKDKGKATVKDTRDFDTCPHMYEIFSEGLL